jgi:insertion element IS1 protein InsB
LEARIPAVYREQATVHTDRDDAHTGLIPAERHKAMTENTRKTDHVKRFTKILRPQTSRLVRGTLSFSKELANHIGTIKPFICHNSFVKAAAFPV